MSATYLEAVFTPSAQVYCMTCNNLLAREALARAAESEKFPGERYYTHLREFPETGIDPDEISAYSEVRCDRCRLDCWISRGDVALCQRFVIEAAGMLADWHLEQTGGMCVAAVCDTRDCNGVPIRLLVTEDEEAAHNGDGGRIVVGAYKLDADGYEESTDWGYCDAETFTQAFLWIDAVCEGGDAWDLYVGQYGEPQ